jgi:selenocysteine-specific elongation factor
MIVGTAGHIDHGKSALVRRLTGTDPDRLKEEKARGITIDLGFAYWPRSDGSIVGFVDVPGHEGLVHNMLAGATGIDVVLLVVAADDGVMPQTREHLAIMDLLGLTCGVVALNKADLVSADRLAAATAEVRGALEETALSGAEIIPVSAVTGAGIDRLTNALDTARSVVRARATDGAFRLFVDRVFSLTGHGTVVTGTVASGQVNVDDQVVMSPSGLPARVRSIHAQNQPVKQGSAGERCALVLAGAGVAKDSVHRGDAVQTPRLHAPTARIDAQLRVLQSEPKSIGQWMPVRVHHGAAEVGGRIVVLAESGIAPGHSGLVQLVLEQPIAAAAGDRFIVRDVSARRTIGGGSFLDLRAPERRRRTMERLAELEILSQPDPARCLETLLRASKAWADLEVFARDRAISETMAADLVRKLDLVALPVAGMRPVMLPSGWKRLSDAVGAVLDRQHAAQPDQIGVPTEALRRQSELKSESRLPVAIFASALQKLVAAGAVAVERGMVRRPGHGVRLSPQDAASWLRIRPLLGGAERFRPPRVRDMVESVGRDEATIRRLLQLATKRGETEEIAKDHFFLSTTVSEMAGIARGLEARLGAAGFTAADFRDQLDNGRKVAIHILEFFDARGFTMRRGDQRRINPHNAGLFDR